MTEMRRGHVGAAGFALLVAVIVPACRRAPACALVEIGFDRRGWPASYTNEQADALTGFQAQEFRRTAPPGAPPRLYTRPGQNTFVALFDGPAEDVVLARCSQAVDAYLPKAPRMPVTVRDSDGKYSFPLAAQVGTPCRPCGDDRR
jgi:hypothetical protein